MKIVRVTVMTVGVVMQSAVNHGTACAAGRGRTVGVCESHAFARQTVEIRRLRNLVAISSRMQPEVVGNHQQHILRQPLSEHRRGGCACRLSEKRAVYPFLRNLLRDRFCLQELE